MLKELYTAAMGMVPNQTRLEVISNNIANAETAGFKRESVFERQLIDASQNLANTPGDVENIDAPIGSYIDFSSGAFRKTDNPLDIAVEGDGFFTLQDEAGDYFFTRGGHYKLDTEGRIIAMDGKMLVGENGPIMIGNEFYTDPLITKDTKSLNIRISESGDFFINDFFIGSLMIAKIDNPETLSRHSSQNFVAGKDTTINFISPEEIRVRQGWIEESNVDVIKEMVEMIELQRLFEAGSKVIQSNDRTLDDSMRVGRFI